MSLDSSILGGSSEEPLRNRWLQAGSEGYVRVCSAFYCEFGGSHSFESRRLDEGSARDQVLPSITFSLVLSPGE